MNFFYGENPYFKNLNFQLFCIAPIYFWGFLRHNTRSPRTNLEPFGFLDVRNPNKHILKFLALCYFFPINAFFELPRPDYLLAHQFLVLQLETSIYPKLTGSFILLLVVFHIINFYNSVLIMAGHKKYNLVPTQKTIYQTYFYVIFLAIILYIPFRSILL